jgi:hypothetical protein
MLYGLSKGLLSRALLYFFKCHFLMVQNKSSLLLMIILHADLQLHFVKFFKLHFSGLLNIVIRYNYAYKTFLL